MVLGGKQMLELLERLGFIALRQFRRLPRLPDLTSGVFGMAFGKKVPPQVRDYLSGRGISD